LTNASLSIPELLSFKAACQNDGFEDKLQKLKEELAHLQGPESCGTADQATVDLTNTPGWGAMMHGLLKPLMHTFANGKQLRTPNSWVWTGTGCANRSLGCIMQHFTSCEPPIPASPASSPAPAGVAEVEQVLMLPTVNETEMSEWSARSSKRTDVYVGLNNSYSLRGDTVIPQRYRKLGWFWYATHMNSFLWRPGHALNEEFHSALTSSGLRSALASGLVLGLHVRQGDACADAWRTGRQCDELGAYMVEVDKLRNATGVTTIYLATDSNTTMDKAASMYPAYTWLRWTDALNYSQQLFAEHPSKSWDAIIGANIQHDRTDINERVARLSSIDMMMLAQCDLFVGKFTSNFFRIAYELRAASCDCVPPFTSLDAPWCFDYAVQAGTSRLWQPDGTYLTQKFAC